MSSYLKMANDNLQSVLNVNTQVRCKQSSVMYISENKELLKRHFLHEERIPSSSPCSYLTIISEN